MSKNMLIFFILILLILVMPSSIFAQNGEDKKPYSEMGYTEKTNYLQDGLGVWGATPQTVDYDEENGKVTIKEGADVVLEDRSIHKNLQIVIEGAADVDLSSFTGEIRGQGEVWGLNGEVKLESGDLVKVTDGDLELIKNAKLGEGTKIDGQSLSGNIKEYDVKEGTLSTPEGGSIMVNGKMFSPSSKENVDIKFDKDGKGYVVSGEDIAIVDVETLKTIAYLKKGSLIIDEGKIIKSGEETVFENYFWDNKIRGYSTPYGADYCKNSECCGGDNCIGDGLTQVLIEGNIMNAYFEDRKGGFLLIRDDKGLMWYKGSVQHTPDEIVAGPSKNGYLVVRKTADLGSSNGASKLIKNVLEISKDPDSKYEWGIMGPFVDDPDRFIGKKRKYWQVGVTLTYKWN